MSLLSIPIGDTMGAYVAEPKADSAPVVIVCQEVFGVTPWVRSVCDRLAAAGYLAIAPDLFWRSEPGMQLSEHNDGELAKAYSMAQSYDREQGLSDLKATVDFASKLPKSNGKIAMLGFCLGGHLSFLAGCRSMVDAAVCFYPTYIVPVLGEAKGLSTPMLVNIAGSDELCGAEDQETVKKALSGSRCVEIRTSVNAGHAFARVGGAHYNEAAAELTWYATFDFLARTLGTESPNKLLARRFVRVLSGGDASDLESILAPDFNNTESWHQPSGSRQNGRKGMSNVLKWLRNGFDDLRLEILDIVEEGDTVVVRVLYTGRHTGEYRGVAATNKYVERKQAHFFKFRDGRIASQHAVRDDLGMLIQLGAIDSSIWRVYG